jgi:uncharacterized protein (TIGR03086 family)
MTEQQMATELLSRSLQVPADVIAGLRPEQWNDPTPCDEWDVRQLVSHLVLGNRRHAALVRGAQIGPRPTGPPEDVLGDDALGTYAASVEDVLRAFGSPDVASTIYQTPIGPIPGSGVLFLRATDAVVHGWDLARATGQTVDAPDFVVAELLTFARTRLADAPPNGPFKPSLSVAQDASMLDQLVAILGRQP